MPKIGGPLQKQSFVAALNRSFKTSIRHYIWDSPPLLCTCRVFLDNS